MSKESDRNLFRTLLPLIQNYGIEKVADVLNKYSKNRYLHSVLENLAFQFLSEYHEELAAKYAFLFCPECGHVNVIGSVELVFETTTNGNARKTQLNCDNCSFRSGMGAVLRKTEGVGSTA